MNEQIPLGDCPLRLGSPLKVSSNAWSAWGINHHSRAEFLSLVKKSEARYSDEWVGTDDRGLQDIAAAAQLAGLTDCNAKLNEAVADAVMREAHSLPSPLAILDVGAGSGSTSLAVLQRLRSLRTCLTVDMVDPNPSALHEGEARIRQSDLLADADLTAHPTGDLDLPRLFPNPTFDLVVSVAALHHHAFLPPAVAAIASVLKPGGLLVVGDWHNSMWLHPGRVCSFLSSLEWPGKDKALEVYAQRFTVTNVARDDPLMEAANEQICRFWRAYAEVRTPELRPYELLEGHRPPSEYQVLMQASGLEPVRPFSSIDTGSGLLCVHVLRKRP